jgi:putative sigma-54 modulation protein
MNLAISGHHVAVTPALRQYITGKLERIRRHFDQVIDVNVIVSVDKLVQKAEINLHVPGRDLFAECSGPDLYAAIDELIDKLDRQVAKYKAQRFGFAHEAIKHQDAVEAVGSE